MKFRMNQKVKIINSKKSDGRYNYGTIVGVEKCQNAYYLGYMNEKEFLSRYTLMRYKVVYVDCVDSRAYEHWYNEEELDKK